MNKPKGYPDLLVMNSEYKPYVVTVPAAKLAKIRKFAPKLANQKMKEWHYKVDSESLKKRIITGLTGEAAVEEMLGLDIIDWTLGKSSKYYHPDIEEFGVGIKTVVYGLHPLVSIKPKCPQIICVKMSESAIVVCGIASIKCLKRYQDLDLVKARGARMRATKAGFYGFSKLVQFKNITQFKKAVKEVK